MEDNQVREQPTIIALISKILYLQSERRQNWTLLTHSYEDHIWLHIHPLNRLSSDEGWKIHITCYGLFYHDLIKKIVPFLVQTSVHFKLIRSVAVLNALNQGIYGSSQIGKACTVYAKDASSAQVLMASIDDLCEGITGPSINSDRIYGKNGVVFYRYGSFQKFHYQYSNGEITPAIRHPNGTLVPDTHTTPSWIIDPFGGIKITPQTPLFIADRYVPIRFLSRSPNHDVQVCVDIYNNKPCVIKSPAILASAYASTQLLHEAQTLQRFAPYNICPHVQKIFEQPTSMIVMEYIQGKTLEEVLFSQLAQGKYMPESSIRSCATRLVQSLMLMYEYGFVYGDLKPANILIHDDTFILIDFEFACPVASNHIAYGWGSRGYQSPQRMQHHAPTSSDDIYSLGALLVFMVSGVDPAREPFHLTPSSLNLHTFNPAVSQNLLDFIYACLNPDQTTRPTLDAAFEVLSGNKPVTFISHSFPKAVEPTTNKSTVNMPTVVAKLCDVLSTKVRQAIQQESLLHLSNHPYLLGYPCADIGIGTGGSLLTLMHADRTINCPSIRAVIHQSSHLYRRYLTAQPSSSVGLFAGSVGHVLTLWQIAHHIQDKQGINYARDLANALADYPLTSPDFMCGAAGRIQAHLWLWQATQDHRHLLAAQQCGKYICEKAVINAEGVAWLLPEGYGPLSGKALLGYGYGVAGIADSLLILMQATGDHRYNHLIESCAIRLQRAALPALTDNGGVCWPRFLAGPPSFGGWCFGSAGIGQFLLRYTLLNFDPVLWNIIIRAARTSANGMRWTNPSLNSGIVGHIHFLLDVADITGDIYWQKEARHLTQLLLRFVTDRSTVQPCGETRNHPTYDYLTGTSGVILCLLRQVSSLTASDKGYFPLLPLGNKALFHSNTRDMPASRQSPLN